MKHLFKKKATNRRFNFAESMNINSACWADLVMWSLGYSKFEDCFNQSCRPPRAPYAYCGKCDKYFQIGNNKK